MACFVAYAIFGVNIVTTKDLTASHLVSPLALFTVRSVCAGALFWLISFFMPGERVAKEDYLKIFAASILGFFFTQITFLMAISEITPMDCSIVSALSPIYTMFIAAVEDMEVLSDVPSATYAYYQSSIKPKPEAKAPQGKTVWRCKVCGYIYEGEELPADYICPLCKHPASDFEKVTI